MKGDQSLDFKLSVSMGDDFASPRCRQRRFARDLFDPSGRLYRSNRLVVEAFLDKKVPRWFDPPFQAAIRLPMAGQKAGSFYLRLYVYSSSIRNPFQ